MAPTTITSVEITWSAAKLTNHVVSTGVVVSG
jgi:hypothetical protein